MNFDDLNKKIMECFQQIEKIVDYGIRDLEMPT